MGWGGKGVGVLIRCSWAPCSLCRAGAGGNQPDQMRGICPRPAPGHPETVFPTLPVLPLLPGQAHPWAAGGFSHQSGLGQPGAQISQSSASLGWPRCSCCVVAASVSGRLASSGPPCPGLTFPHLPDPKLTAFVGGQCSSQDPRWPVPLVGGSSPLAAPAWSHSRVGFSGPEGGEVASDWSRTRDADPGRSCSGHPRTPPGHVAPVPLFCGHYRWETKAHSLP